MDQYSMIKYEIASYLHRLKIHVINNRSEYPSYLTDDAIMGITIHFDDNVDSALLSNGITGLCLKDGLSREWTGTKENDMLISLSAICVEADDAKKTREAVMKSIITHEFMHSISVGFAVENNSKESYYKDEAYTDHLAQKLFNKLCTSEFYYTPYPSLRINEYSMVNITDEGIQCYFKGKINRPMK